MTQPKTIGSSVAAVLIAALGVFAPGPASAAQVIVPTGGIEAPTQPSRESSAQVRKTARPAPGVAAGARGTILVSVRDLVEVRGQENNVIGGIGLVTGLAGTGDSGGAARQAIRNLLLTQNVNLDLGAINSSNVAVVWVEAVFVPGVKPGRRVDVRLSSLYDADSLVGGTLVTAELMDMSGSIVYGTASGPISVGGFSASGEGASVKRNHLTVGIIPQGCKVEREVPTQLVSDHGFIYLDMQARKGSFGNVVRVTESINEVYPGAAVAVDAMTVSVKVPGDLPTNQHVAYLHSLLKREIEPEATGRVVINERTGVIVMGEGVRITRGAITKGNLTVTIAETQEVSQPGAFSNGTTQNVARTNLLVEEEDRPLTIINGATTLSEVVEVLNILGVTPRDMIDILQAMVQQGMLHADLVAM